MYQIPASTSEPGSCQHPLVRGWCLWLLNMAPPDPSGKPAGTNDAKLPSLERDNGAHQVQRDLPACWIHQLDQNPHLHTCDAGLGRE